MGSSSKQGGVSGAEHRESTLPVGEGNRILDKLLLLEQVISPDDVLQVLQDTGCIDSRRCTLTFEVTCWLVLAMGVLTEMPIRAVFKAARRLMPDDWDPDRTTLCKARQRLGVAPVRLLLERLARPLATAQTPGAFYQRWRKVAVDGCVYNVPDSDANAAAFGYPQGGRGAGAFPQVRKLSLVEVGTHAELALLLRGIKQKGGDEKSMAAELLGRLDATMLLLWDRGFFSYKLWQGLLLRGCAVLARVKAGLVLHPTRQLADGSHLARIYPCYSMRNKGQGGIVVRVIRYTHDDERRAGCGQEHVLLTNLLDARAHPARELICLYHERWEVELTFDEQKTHQNPWRVSKSADLRSETPLGVLQETYALSIGHYATRALMATAARREGLDPDRLSFVGCLRVLRNRLGEFPAQAEAQGAWLRALLAELAAERIEPRRDRINPRVVRVKMSKFKKKRKEHRGLRPLDRTFKETIIVQGAA